MALALVAVSGLLTVHLFWHWRYLNKDLKESSPQAAQMIAHYNRVDAPMLQDFLKRLTEFGRSHPDFVPILNKYQISFTPAPSTTAAPGAATAPVTAAPKPATTQKK